MNFANSFKTNGRVVGLGGSGEDWAESDVICAFALGSDGLFNAVGRFADDDWSFDLRAHFFDRIVILTHVHTRCAISA